MFCWFFFSPIKRFFTRIVTYFLAGISLASAQVNVKLSTEMGAHFNLITVWPHRYIPPTDSHHMWCCAESDQLIHREIYLFISFLQFPGFLIKICSTSCWMVFLKDLRFTCEALVRSFMRKCNKPATYLSSHFYALCFSSKRSHKGLK